MAGNNTIQILRGNNVKTNSSINGLTLLDGQPLYDRATGYLYIGQGGTIASTSAINAHYANSAGSASSATTASMLTRNIYFNGNGVNARWNGSATEVVYAPTALGSVGRVWGIASNGQAAWIAQTEVPGTIDHANTADVAYEVSGSNVSGSVASAETADTATIASSVRGCLTIRMNPCVPTYYNGSKDVGIDIYSAIEDAIDHISAPTNMVTTNTTQDITGQKTFNSPIVVSGTSFFHNEIGIGPKDGTNSSKIFINSNGDSSPYIKYNNTYFYLSGSPSGNILTDGASFTGDDGPVHAVSTFTNVSSGGYRGYVAAVTSNTYKLRIITAWIESSVQKTFAIQYLPSGTSSNYAASVDLASASVVAGKRTCLTSIVPTKYNAHLYCSSDSGITNAWYTVCEF